MILPSATNGGNLKHLTVQIADWAKNPPDDL